MLTHTNPATPHQFARSKADGRKYFFPFGAASCRMLAAELPTVPQFAAVSVQCETCESIQPARQMHTHPTGLQCHTCKHGTTRDLVREVAGTAADFEFYPTTTEIIEALRRDLRRIKADGYSRHEPQTVLDIGAGSGKVLLALRQDGFTGLHAIEKSTPLLQALPPDVLIIGTDFREQTLLNKPVDVTFSNPPYSEFEAWAVKIIRESLSRLIYLVIPQRWQDSPAIADALKFADKTAHKLGDYTFDQPGTDRRARASVHLLRIAPLGRDGSQHTSGELGRKDAFERQFAEQFAELLAAFDKTAEAPAADHTHPKARHPDKFSALVPGEDYAAALVSMYQADLAHIQRNYAAAAVLDPDLLREMDISPSKICDGLRARLSGLRNTYWHELFSKFDKITNRLTSKARNALLHQLHAHAHVDFTLSNIEAVIIWVLKNANKNFDQQLVDTYEHMIEKANVRAYKSNQRTFEQGGWRYCSERDQWSHFALDYRIVCQYIGGMSRYSWESHKLEDRAAQFVEDLRTVAHNLGFQRPALCELPDSTAHSVRWTRAELETFDCILPATSTHKHPRRVELFTVRAYGNGNLHLKLNKDFILALNVEHGRLKGWIKTPAQAAEDLGDKAAGQFFKSNLALPAGYNPLQLAA